MTNVKSSQQELKIQLSEGVKELKELKTFAIADMTSKVVCIVLTPARRASEARLHEVLKHLWSASFPRD